ncbi:MAG: hypothetical protein KF774_12115 [Planctomyces sp.]|nr:hypothetical protein [Planctomyces sp.]
MKSSTITAAMLAGLLFPGGRLLGNEGFIPGDAYFLCTLDEDATLAWKPFLDGATDEFVLQYSPPEERRYMGYWTGYGRLRITDISRDEVRTLVRLYHTLRREPDYIKHVEVTYTDAGDRREFELGPFMLFVYNRDFGRNAPWLGQEATRIGLLYNENWMRGGQSDPLLDAPEGQGDRPGGTERPPGYDPKWPIWKGQWAWSYRALLPGHEPVVDDWKHGPEVPGLAVRGANDHLYSMQFRAWLPSVLSIPASEIQFVIVPTSPFGTENFLERFYKQESLSEIFVVTGTEAMRCRWFEGYTTSDMELVERPMPLIDLKSE